MISFLSFSRDLVPIIAALEYNPWFTKVVAKGNKLVSRTVRFVSVCQMVFVNVGPDRSLSIMFWF